MSATREGGLKAAKKNKQLYGEDFYKKIGAKGGRAGNTGGFYANRELAREAGRKGGSKSSRKGIKNKAKEPRKATWLKRLLSRA